MEDYFERVVARLTGAGLPLVRDRELLSRSRREHGGRDLRAHTTWATGAVDDYLGLGVGAVSTLGAVRRRNAPSLGRYLGALRAGRTRRESSSRWMTRRRHASA